jgi:hypothetical protein
MESGRKSVYPLQTADIEPIGVTTNARDVQQPRAVRRKDGVLAAWRQEAQHRAKVDVEANQRALRLRATAPIRQRRWMARTATAAVNAAVVRPLAARECAVVWVGGRLIATRASPISRSRVFTSRSRQRRTSSRSGPAGIFSKSIGGAQHV